MAGRRCKTCGHVWPPPIPEFQRCPYCDKLTMYDTLAAAMSRAEADRRVGELERASREMAGDFSYAEERADLSRGVLSPADVMVAQTRRRDDRPGAAA